METENTDEIKRLTDQLTQASHKLAEVMYAQASAKAQEGAEGTAQSAGASETDEDVVDADFEEVNK